jgi:dihydrofolate reductase
MRRLIAWDMISLDGFFSRDDGNLDWFVFEEEIERYVLTTQMEASTLVFGRRTWQMMKDYWTTADGTIAEFMNRVEKVVFSLTLKEADWQNSRLGGSDVAGEINRLKALPGTDIFVFGSADFTATLMRERLIDEYRFGINPVILGKGVPFFKGGEPEHKLRLTEAKPLKSGVVILHYVPEPG